MAQPQDIHKMSVKIIEAIKQHPVLYINDVKGVDIKLQDLRQKVWKYIADDIGLDATYMRLRWKNLRDTFCRIAKYKNNPDKGARRKKWIYEDHLSFLTFPFEPNYEHQTCEVTEEYIQLITSKNMSSEGLLEQLEDKAEEVFSGFVEVVKPVVSKSEKDTDVKSVKIVNNQKAEPKKDVDKDVLVQQIEAKFRKIRPKGREVSILQSSQLKGEVLAEVAMPVTVTTSLEPPKKKRKMKIDVQVNIDMNNKKQQEEHPTKRSSKLFFENMSKTVKQFPEELQRDVKFNICKAIADAEMKNEREKARRKLDPVHSLPKLLLIPCHLIDKVK